MRKLRSTPADPSRAILAGLEQLAAGAVELTHGSTVATNAVLERRGARIALLATAGFEDVLRIGRQTRRELYNFSVEAPRPLVEPGLDVWSAGASGARWQRTRSVDRGGSDAGRGLGACGRGGVSGGLPAAQLREPGA